MQNSDAMWYDYETEEQPSAPQARWRSLRILALIAATVAAAYVCYSFIA